MAAAKRKPRATGQERWPANRTEEPGDVRRKLDGMMAPLVYAGKRGALELGILDNPGASAQLRAWARRKISARLGQLVTQGEKFLGRKKGTHWHTWAEGLVAEHGGRRITEETIWRALKVAADAEDSPIHEVLAGRRPHCQAISGHHEGRHVHVWMNATNGPLRGIALRTVRNTVAQRNAETRARRRATPRSLTRLTL